jgi:beta-N-acetylhexosaminidase
LPPDQEGGTVSRIDTNPSISQRKYPSPQEIYNTQGLTGIQKEDQTVAKILHQNGINMNFALLLMLLKIRIVLSMIEP